ncbi:hypothetical protein HZS_402, partial [Henneguya salminicola]
MDDLKIFTTSPLVDVKVKLLEQAFNSLGLTLNASKSAILCGRGLSENFVAPLPVVSSQSSAYKCLCVKEFRKPARALNANTALAKAFELIRPVLSSGLNSPNAIAAINTFAMSHLWYLEENKRIAVEPAPSVPRPVVGSLVSPKALRCRAAYAMLLRVRSIIEAPPDVFVKAFVDLSFLARMHARIKTTFVSILDSYIDSFVMNIPELPHPAVVGDSELSQSNKLHIPQLLSRELPKHWCLLKDEPVHTTTHVADNKPDLVVFYPGRIFVVEVGVFADSDIDKGFQFQARAVSRCIQQLVLKAAARILFAVTASNATTNIENAAMLSPQPSRRVDRSDPNSLESSDPLLNEELIEVNSQFLPPLELSQNSRENATFFPRACAFYFLKMGGISSMSEKKCEQNIPRATEKEESDDSSSISSSSSSQPSPVQPLPLVPVAQVESASAILAPLSITKKPDSGIGPVIPRRALNIRVSTLCPLQTAADSSKKRRRGRRGGKRHKNSKNRVGGGNSGVKTGVKGPARPKGSQQRDQGSKAKAAVKRRRIASSKTAKAREPSQQPLIILIIQALSPCAQSTYPGYTPFPGYGSYPAAPFQASLAFPN